MDLRLITIAKRAFRIAPSVRQAVLLDQIMLTLGCSAPRAGECLDDLIASQYVIQRGSGSGTLLFPGPNLDSDILRSVGVEIPRVF